MKGDYIMEMNYASNGKANAGLTTGIIGTALGVLNGGAGILNGAWGQPPAQQWVNRYEAEQQGRIAQLEGEVKLRDSNVYTDGKLLELYKYFDGELRGVRDTLCAQAVHNQKTEDSFVLARQDIAAVKADFDARLKLEAERRCCADNATINYANATFYPKMVAGVTVGTETTAQSLYNPIPDCGCCK